MSNEVSAATEKKPDLKELAKILSDAYYNILQYTSQPEQNVRARSAQSSLLIFHMTHRHLFYIDHQ